MVKQTPPTLIRSVAKAMQILMYLAEEPDPRSARETARALGMPVATTYHLLETLASQGMVAKTNRAYHLGPRIGALADAFHRRTAPHEFLLAPLRELAHETGETAYVSGWQWDDAVLLATVEGSHAVGVKRLHTGYRGHNHARASGKVLLAFRPDAVERHLARHELAALTPNTITDPDALSAELEATRRRGYAVDEEEFAPGVSCVSAPVLEHGVGIAAYTVAVPTERFHERRDELVAAVLRAAAHAGSAPVVAAEGAR
jgi:IclR family transcriptional regulator, acetate operon repressor